MKKLLALLLVLAMVCSMAFIFTACDDTGDQGGGSGSVDGGDTGDQGGNGDQGGEDDEGFNQEYKDSGVSVAGPEDSAAKGENDKDYIHGGNN